MARYEKWCEGVSSKQPVSQVAGLVLQARLKAVWQRLPPAALKSEEDVEFVHRLRVATRRSVAALRIFRQSLPRRRSREIREELRQIRRAAGEARDLDVLLERLAETYSGDPAGGLAAIRRRIQQQRREAQGPIVAVYERLVDEQFAQKIDRLLKKVRFRPKRPSQQEPTFGQTARDQLRPLIRKFSRASRGDLSDTKALHQLRICGKKLRYAIEVFAGVLQPECRRELYPMVKQLQDHLGAINDHAAARRRFEQWLITATSEQESASLGELLIAEQNALVARHQEFLAWWTPQRSAELQRRLEETVA